MKNNEKIQIEKGDVLLLKNKDATIDCVLILDRLEEGIKILINSNVRTYKTSDFLFHQDSVFSLSLDCK
ncbi:MAG TPA: hypothetical protein EYG21_02120 [Nitrospinaceae bacterium]|jgi:hypothetical protein|nr:hypothetical protein [Nitrospinaceae bacterium]